jgi:phospholipase/carboxylesterase
VSDAPARAALDFVMDRPDGAEDGSVVAVFLHGRGSNRRDLQGLRPLLPPAWTLLTPEAPFPASTWGYGPGSAWYRYVADDRVVEETLDESMSKLDDFLGQVPELVGFQPGSLVLGGFSHAALDETGSAPPTVPIFWGHGVSDPAIPIALAEKGRARLRHAAANLVARDYRIGHWIAEEEVQRAVEAVETALA